MTDWKREVKPVPPPKPQPKHHYKMSKNAAGYQHPASPEHQALGETCSTCVNFIRPNSCRGVAGYIRAGDYCGVNYSRKT